MKSNISGMIRSKETLLIDVSHELRSPLTRMKLASEFIDDENIKGKIKIDIREMETMITKLLETYRIENIHGKIILEPSDIVNLTRKVISGFTNAKINFKTDFQSKEINIDKEKMEIVLRNIIDNAIKYSNGKSVDVRIEDSNGESTKVVIKDYGNGIEEKELKKIFEPFYRVDKSRDKKIGGFGLGLSLVKKILDLHDAEIKVTSKLSHGSEFNIIFKDK